MFFEVLDHAFQGCGTSLEQVRRSREYRKVLTAEESVPDTLKRGSMRAESYRIGNLQLGKLKYSYLAGKGWPSIKRERADAAALPSRLPDPTVRAGIRMLGRVITRRAKRCLPDAALKLAREWQNADSRRQIAITREFFALLPSRPSPSRVLDWEQQTAAGVLPGLYRKVGSRRAKMPNCIGKTQLTAAFFAAAGEPCLSAFPLKISGDVQREIKEEFARLARKEIYRKGNRCSRSYRLTLSSIIAEGVQLREQPAFMHGALLVRLRDRSWLLVDPNVGVTARLQGRLGNYCTELSRGFRRSDLSNPGIVAPFSTNTMDWFRAMIKPAVMAAAREADYLRREIILKGGGLIEAADYLAYSKTLPYLLDSFSLSRLGDLFNPWLRAIARENGRRNATRTRKLRQEAAETVFNLLLSRHTKVRTKDDPMLTREEIARLPRPVQLEVLGRLPALLLNSVLMHMESLWDEVRSDNCHPHMEIGIYEWQMAAAVLGHLSVVDGTWKEVEPVLADHTFSQFRLLHSALTMLSDLRRRPPDEVRLAAEALELMPYQLLSTRMVLAALRAHNKLGPDRAPNQRKG